MTPSLINAAVVADRITWITAMLDGIRALPLRSRGEFEPYRVSQRVHLEGGWSLWDDRVGIHRR